MPPSLFRLAKSPVQIGLKLTKGKLVELSDSGKKKLKQGTQI